MFKLKMTLVVIGAAIAVFSCLGSNEALAKKDGNQVRSESGSSGRGSGTDNRQVQSGAATRDEGASGGGSSSGSSGHDGGANSGSSHGGGLGEVSSGVDKGARGAGGETKTTIIFRDYDRL